jgi:DNA-binding NtrC family response regulator
MAGSPTAPGATAAETIMVVDGEVLVRHAIADYLRSCGFTVIEAASSDEALAVLSDATIALDAILCDARITGSMGGFELARHVRATRPGLEVVLAGNIQSRAEAAAEFCDEGPQLARPYDPQGVVDFIKRLLAKADRGR